MTDDAWEDDQDFNQPFYSAGPHDTSQPTDLLSSWSSIPWHVEAPRPNLPSQTPLLDPGISEMIRAHDRNTVHNTQAANWKKAMSKLLMAYLWLKEKTNNWTNSSMFIDYTRRFCKCAPTAPRSTSWVDVVDVNGQQRLKYNFCSCLPRSVQVLTTGFLASCPISPSTAFSMQLLAYQNYAWHNSNVRTFPYVLTQQLFSEEQSETLWNKRKTAVSNDFSRRVMLHYVLNLRFFCKHRVGI
jgi:hypothetical protein